MLLLLACYETLDSEEGNQAEPVTAEAWTATPTPREEITPDAVDTPTPTPGTASISASLPQAPETGSAETGRVDEHPIGNVEQVSPSVGGASESENSSVEVEAVIASYPWPYATALRVARCENAYHAYGYWRPGAIGAHEERGIMQIDDVHIDRIHKLGYTWDDMLKVEPNIAVAYDLWAEQGWGPWSCYWR